MKKAPHKKPVEYPWYEEAGRNVGGWLANGAVKALKTLTGFGDYEVATNSLLAQATDGQLGSQIPLMVNSKVANIVRHREYLGNVRGSPKDFNSTVYDLNPGLDETFPWGYALANCYTTYRMRGMVAEFVSLSSEYSTSSYLGYVGMATQYNSLDAPFDNKKVMMNAEYSCSAKPSRNLMHPIECARDQLVTDHLYIRAGDVPPNADKRLYDLGKLTVATGGQLTGNIIGELWITYEIEFFQPKLGGIMGSLTNSAHYRGTSTISGVFTTFEPAVGNTLTLKVLPGNREIELPEHIAGGQFLIEVVWIGGVTDISAMSIVPGNRCTFIQNSFSSFPTAKAQGTGTGMITARINVTGESASFTLNGVVSETRTFDLYITQMPSVLARTDRSHIVVDDQVGERMKREEREKYIETLESARLERDLKLMDGHEWTETRVVNPTSRSNYR